MSAALSSLGKNRTRLAILLGVLFIAFLLRGWAALRLPLDFDEPVYMQVAYDYASALEAGDLNGIIDYSENREHPPLGKLLYSFVYQAVGLDAQWMIKLYAGRILSAVLGALSVLILALVDPLAGGLLAVHTMTVKYTAQFYLEALPHLTSLVAILAMTRSGKSRDRWFWLSALALGTTAAGKFTYLPIGFVILYLAIWEKRFNWRDLLLYFVIALLAFWLFNPMLWRDPFGRLADTLFFHMQYSQSEHVQQSGYPWYQPFYWISRSPPATWHPEVFFYFGLDGLIFLLALPGMYWEWRERRWVVVWIAVGLIFLLLWPTKWPQYTLVLVPALCLAASTTMKHAYHWLQEQEAYWGWVSHLLPAPPRAFWILLVAIILGMGIFYTMSTYQLVVGNLGWSNINTESSILPSNTVYDIASIVDGQIILGTERGAVIWEPGETTEISVSWVVFTAENSPLPDDRVLAVLAEETGGVWFGTEAGLARFDGEVWQVYRAEDMGLVGDKVYALAMDGEGRILVGTDAGAAVFDGTVWESLTTANSGLLDNRVLSIAVEPSSFGEKIWFGTRSGVSRFDTTSGEWQSYNQDFDPQGSGVVDLLYDSSGRMWAATTGDGLGVWDGGFWQFFNTGNSEIPFNTVNTITEVEPGLFWIGTAAPAEVGGVLAEFDGETWKQYTSRDTGFSGAEALVIIVDRDRRRWIGTRTTGIDIHEPNP